MSIQISGIEGIDRIIVLSAEIELEVRIDWCHSEIE